MTLHLHDLLEETALTAALADGLVQDGSLGILYPTPDGWAVATRGSFDSEQARHATTVLRSRYADWAPETGTTVLVEIVYPATRIVLSYDGLDDLLLLGAVETATGRTFGVRDVQTGRSPWPGPVTTTFPARTLGDALALEPRRNAEGVVVRFVESDLLVKLKPADYVALHRLVTGTSARSLWEHLAVDACRDLVHEPKHWGSQLGIGPDRAAEVLAAGDAWREHLLSGVPDEFSTWVQDTTAALMAQVKALVAEAHATVESIRDVTDRRTAFEAVRHSALQKPVMDLWSGRPDNGAVVRTAWRLVQPSGNDRPFAQTEEAN